MTELVCLMTYVVLVTIELFISWKTQGNLSQIEWELNENVGPI